MNYGDTYFKSNINVRKTPTSRTMNLLNYVNFLTCSLLASDWFKDNQLLSTLTHAHNRDTVPLRVARNIFKNSTKFVH